MENFDLLPDKPKFKKKLTKVRERKQSSRASRPGADQDVDTVEIMTAVPERKQNGLAIRPGADKDDFALLGAIPKRKIGSRTEVPSRKFENMYESRMFQKYDFNVGFKMDEGCPEKSVRMRLLERKCKFMLMIIALLEVECVKKEEIWERFRFGQWMFLFLIIIFAVLT